MLFDCGVFRNRICWWPVVFAFVVELGRFVPSFRDDSSTACHAFFVVCEMLGVPVAAASFCWWRALFPPFIRIWFLPKRSVWLPSKLLLAPDWLEAWREVPSVVRRGSLEP